jgi:hypothetical protein
LFDYFCHTEPTAFTISDSAFRITIARDDICGTCDGVFIGVNGENGFVVGAGGVTLFCVGR